MFKYVGLEDLRLDLLPKLRIMASNNSGQTHLWNSMTDEELLQSTRLYTKDRTPVKQVITWRLVEFGRKHLPDKFYLENDQRKSLRNIITCEMIANTLIHREYTSSYQAKFVIERNRMYVENANRATQAAQLTPDIIEPNPKNSIIASFFRHIGYADQLGSGVRNLFKYSKIYSGEEPVFDEGDAFRITVPLDERLGGKEENPTQAVQNPTQGKCVTHKVSDLDKRIFAAIEEKLSLTQSELAMQLDVNLNTVKYRIKRLMSIDLLGRVGSSQKGHWIVK